jgi:hypothetical protein
MSTSKTKACTFCKAEILEDAIKCRYCQSSLFGESGASKSERLADLVIKCVGVVPLMMTLLLAIAGTFGLQTMSEVKELAKKADASARSIQERSKLIDKLVGDYAERRMEVLLNELPIDSTAPTAERIRQELRESLNLLKKEAPDAAGQRSTFLLVEALMSYYDHKYDDALDFLKKADKSVNQLRLSGIVTHRKAGEVQKQDNQEGNRLFERAYTYFSDAETMAKSENRLLIKNKKNRAMVAARLGKYEVAENIWLDIFKRGSPELRDYYLVASMYSRWAKPAEACKYLEEGIGKGLADAGEITRKDVAEDPDFQNLKTSRDQKIQACYAEIVKKLPG